MPPPASTLPTEEPKWTRPEITHTNNNRAELTITSTATTTPRDNTTVTHTQKNNQEPEAERKQRRQDEEKQSKSSRKQQDESRAHQKQGRWESEPTHTIRTDATQPDTHLQNPRNPTQAQRQQTMLGNPNAMPRETLRPEAHPVQGTQEQSRSQTPRTSRVTPEEEMECTLDNREVPFGDQLQKKPESY